MKILNFGGHLSATCNDIIRKPMKSHSIAEYKVHSNGNKVMVRINGYRAEKSLDSYT